MIANQYSNYPPCVDGTPCQSWPCPRCERGYPSVLQGTVGWIALAGAATVAGAPAVATFAGLFALGRIALAVTSPTRRGAR